jgi:hypothetical protein
MMENSSLIQPIRVKESFFPHNIQVAEGDGSSYRYIKTPLTAVTGKNHIINHIFVLTPYFQDG